MVRILFIVMILAGSAVALGAIALTVWLTVRATMRTELERFRTAHEPSRG